MIKLNGLKNPKVAGRGFNSGFPLGRRICSYLDLRYEYTLTYDIPFIEGAQISNVFVELTGSLKSDNLSLARKDRLGIRRVTIRSDRALFAFSFIYRG